MVLKRTCEEIHFKQECQTDTKYARLICGKFNGYDNILGAGYSNKRTDTVNSVFGEFKGHNSGVPEGFGRL